MITFYRINMMTPDGYKEIMYPSLSKFHQGLCAVLNRQHQGFSSFRITMKGGRQIDIEPYVCMFRDEAPF
jgi:hypothetical protein